RLARNRRRAHGTFRIRGGRRVCNERARQRHHQCRDAEFTLDRAAGVAAVALVRIARDSSRLFNALHGQTRRRPARGWRRELFDAVGVPGRRACSPDGDALHPPRGCERRRESSEVLPRSAGDADLLPAALSSSTACARLVSLSGSPPSMRAISGTRSASARIATSAVVTPAGAPLVTRIWRWAR